MRQASWSFYGDRETFVTEAYDLKLVRFICQSTMTSLTQDDPFLEAQADVLSTLNTTRSLYSSYVRIRSLASSAASPELAQARSELETTLHDLTSDLQDLVDSVKAIESDPFRYGVDINEVARRRKLVEDVGREVEDMGKELKNVANNQKRDIANGSTLPPPSAFDPDIPERDDYEAFEQQRQVEIMHEQDEALDGVFKTVGNLRQQANDIGRELEEQHVMLDEVDTLADRVGGKLQTGIKKVGWVIKKNEGVSLELTLVSAAFKLILLRYNVKLLHRCPHLRADTSSGTFTHPLMDTGKSNT
ncbi:MAG: hypothetical protein Q9199_001770 [Rusavskia elegans]